MLDANWNPSPRELRQFAGIWLPLFVAAVGAVALLRFDSSTAATTIWTVGLVICAVAFALPGFGKVVYVGLMAAAYPLGWAVSHLVLGAAYYLVFVPIGLALRLSGRDPLPRERNSASYWERHEPGADPASYFRQF